MDKSTRSGVPITADVSMDFGGDGDINKGGSVLGQSVHSSKGPDRSMSASTHDGGMPVAMEQKERRIDNTQFEPISHKKSLTLVNYFILNTSHFLNSFSNVAEGKIHQMDEKLDELETLIAIVESKLDSLPDDAFLHPPPQNDEEDNEGV